MNPHPETTPEATAEALNLPLTVAALCRSLAGPECASAPAALGGLAYHVGTTLGLPPAERWHCALAVALRDVGKVFVPPAMLQHPGRLSETEWRFVRTHPARGAELLRRLPGLAATADLVQAHHERLDGTGYPQGLAGAAIPAGARVVAVLDAFDALVNVRAWRAEVRDPLGAVAVLAGEGPGCWDPEVVKALGLALRQGGLELLGEGDASKDLLRARMEVDVWNLVPAVARDIADSAAALRGSLSAIRAHAAVLGRVLSAVDDGRDFESQRLHAGLDALLEDVGEAAEDAWSTLGRLDRLNRELRRLGDAPVFRGGPAHLGRALEGAITLVQAQVRGGPDIEVRMEGRPLVRMPERELEHVLVLVLLAAIRSAEREQVQVAVQVNCGAILLEITRSGAPPTKAELARLFDPSPHLGQLAEPGLHLARSVLEACGGELTVRHEGGLAFTVCVPDAAIPAANPSRSSDPQ